MAVTRLNRKGLRNKLKAKQRKQRIKALTRKPPILNVDVEAIKAEFAQKSGKPTQQNIEVFSSEESSATSEDTASSAEATSAADTPKGAVSPEASTEETAENENITDTPIEEVNTTAETRKPAKASVEDEETAEKAVAEDDVKVAPDVVTPEAGTPEETPSEAEEDANKEK